MKGRSFALTEAFFRLNKTWREFSYHIRINNQNGKTSNKYGRKHVVASKFRWKFFVQSAILSEKNNPSHHQNARNQHDTNCLENLRIVIYSIFQIFAWILRIFTWTTKNGVKFRAFFFRNPKNVKKIAAI